MDSIKETRQCAHCGKNCMEIGSNCTRCKDTRYCGKDYQKSAWLEHNLVCSEDVVEKAVLRASWLLQKMVLASRERANIENFIDWHWSTDKSRLYIKYSSFPGSFSPFKPTIAPTEEERKMILSAMQCRGDVACFSGLLSMLLKNVPVIIEEVNMSMTTPKKDVRRYEVSSKKLSGHSDSHYVFKISSTRNENKWYMNLTASQFGIHKTVHEVALYMEKYGKLLRTIAPLGTSRSHHLAMGGATFVKSICTGIQFRQELGVATAVEEAVQAWKSRSAITASDFLALAVNKDRELEGLVVKSMDQYVSRYDRATELAKLPSTVDPVNEEKLYKRMMEDLEYEMFSKYGAKNIVH